MEEKRKAEEVRRKAEEELKRKAEEIGGNTEVEQKRKAVEARSRARRTGTPSSIRGRNSRRQKQITKAQPGPFIHKTAYLARLATSQDATLRSGLIAPRSLEPMKSRQEAHADQPRQRHLRD